MRGSCTSLTMSHATSVKKKLFFDPLIFFKITTPKFFKFEKLAQLNLNNQIGIGIDKALNEQ